MCLCLPCDCWTWNIAKSKLTTYSFVMYFALLVIWLYIFNLAFRDAFLSHFLRYHLSNLGYCLMYTPFWVTDKTKKLTLSKPVNLLNLITLILLIGFFEQLYQKCKPYRHIVLIIIAVKKFYLNNPSWVYLKSPFCKS